MEHLIYVICENGRLINLAPCSLRSELQCLPWSPRLRWEGVNYSCAISSASGPIGNGVEDCGYSMFEQITP